MLLGGRLGGGICGGVRSRTILRSSSGRGPPPAADELADPVPPVVVEPRPPPRPARTSLHDYDRTDREQRGGDHIGCILDVQ